MKKFLTVLFAVTLVASRLCAQMSSPEASVRFEVWQDCLCGGPTHARSYEQLEAERAKRMEFGAVVQLTPENNKLTAFSCLMKYVGDQKFRSDIRVYWMGVIYRRAEAGTGYAVAYRGSLAKFQMRQVRDGDLVVFYPESF